MLRCSLLLPAAIILSSCAAPRSLPPYEPPLAKTEYQHVRTTAYFDGEADHRAYTNHNALGSCLQCGHINSAAADWSRWPAGTVFQLMQTGQTYIVDDYGWALAGTNTIDLYRPSRAEMNAWGVRRVDIHILQWGDPRESYSILASRASYRHVDRMLRELRPELASSSFPATPSSQPPPVTVARAIPVAYPADSYTSSSTYPRPSDSGPELRSFNSTW